MFGSWPPSRLYRSSCPLPPQVEHGPVMVKLAGANFKRERQVDWGGVQNSTACCHRFHRPLCLSIMTTACPQPMPILMARDVSATLMKTVSRAVELPPIKPGGLEIIVSSRNVNRAVWAVWAKWHGQQCYL